MWSNEGRERAELGINSENQLQEIEKPPKFRGFFLELRVSQLA